MLLTKLTPHLQRLSRCNQTIYAVQHIQGRINQSYKVQRFYTTKNDENPPRPVKSFAALPGNASLTSFKPKPVQNERELLKQKNDPDVFGTLSNPNSITVHTEEQEDPDDLVEQDYLEKQPLRSQKLSTKQYATLILDHFKNYRFKEAIDVVEVRMLKVDRVQPESYIYNLLISELGRLGYVKKAFKLYNKMKKRGLKVVGATYTALFNGCATTPFRKDGLERAKQLREIMIEKGDEPNTQNYHAMMKAFGRGGDLVTVFELMDEMKEKKIPIEVRTFNFLLQAAYEDGEHGLRHALIVWHKIYRHGMRPDIYSFNMMLACARHCGIGNVESMQKMIGEIMFTTRKGLPSKVNTTKRVQGDQEEMLVIDDTKMPLESETTKEMTLEPIPYKAPNLLAREPNLGSLVALGHIDNKNDTLMLFGGVEGFLRQIDVNKALPNIKTFTQLLELIPPTYAAEKELLMHMRKYGVRTDVDFFNNLMKKRVIRMDYSGARKVLELIAAARLEMDIATYGILAMTCETHESAIEFLDLLTDKGIKLNIPILGALLKNGCYHNSYPYILHILQLVIEGRLKPSKEFWNIIERHHSIQHIKFKNPANMLPKHETDEFFAFSKQIWEWKRNMGLAGLSQDEVLQRIRESPFQQYKENQSDGAEHLKNTRIRHLWKKGHSLHKFRNAKLTDDGGYQLPQSQIDSENGSPKILGKQTKNNIKKIKD